jgi:pyruvate kinase
MPAADATANPTDSHTATLRRRVLTKIVATVGPASAEPETIGKLIDAGVSIFRLNFSHGDRAEHTRQFETIRAVAKERGTPTAILGDLQGPKIRVGKVEDGGIELETGATVVFQRAPITASAVSGGPQRFSSTYERLVDEVQPGQRLLVNDGAIRMLVVDRRPDEIECTVTDGGLVTSGKGINLPDATLTVETITDRDWENVSWSIERGIDFLALSFVRRGADIDTLREGILDRTEAGDQPLRPISIIAKIEVPPAIDHIDEIVGTADGIMIARGDLGVEMDLAEVPVLQKRLVQAAHAHGKPCIVATQMLESMIEHRAPTRAEVTDIATAILDQSDGIMLSGETAVGRYPVVAVEYMRRIAASTEAYIAAEGVRPSPPEKPRAERYHMAALAFGGWTVAQDLDAVCVAVWSQTGGGARYLSQNAFHIPILAATSDERAARQMQLLRGVEPHVTEVPKDLATFTHRVDVHVQQAGIARPGEVCLLIAGEPLGRPRVTNRLAILIVGDPTSGYSPSGALPDRE